MQRKLGNTGVLECCTLPSSTVENPMHLLTCVDTDRDHTDRFEPLEYRTGNFFFFFPGGIS